MAKLKTKRKQKSHRWLMLTVATLAAGGFGAVLLLSDPGPSSKTSIEITPWGDRVETVAAGELPSFTKQAGVKVQETYRYAATHPEVLQYIPCTCGCRNSGHRHNGDCYVKERHEDGRITFTSHAAT